MSMTSSQMACSASVHVPSKKINVPCQPTRYRPHVKVLDQIICKRFTTGSPSVPAGGDALCFDILPAPSLLICVITLTGILETAVLRSYTVLTYLTDLVGFYF